MGERALENRIKKLKALEEQKKALETQIEGLLGGDDIIEKTFKGPIQQQLRDALQYIRNVVITEKVMEMQIIVRIVVVKWIIIMIWVHFVVNARRIIKGIIQSFF